jgi:hypothetical protein
MFTAHLPYGFSAIKLQDVTADGPQFGKGGFEVDLLYLACLAALVLGIDRTFLKSFDKFKFIQVRHLSTLVCISSPSSKT